MARGSKQCPNCRNICGNRKKICECGHKFIIECSAVELVNHPEFHCKCKHCD